MITGKPDPEWLHTTGVRFNSREHWQSQWHTITDRPDIDPASATPAFLEQWPDASAFGWR